MLEPLGTLAVLVGPVIALKIHDTLRAYRARP